MKNLTGTARAAGEWRDLQTRGFVILRSFLTPEELTRLRNDHAATKARFGMVQTIHVDAPIVKAFRPRLDAISQAVGAATDIRADAPSMGAYVEVERDIRYDWQGWHQDALTYYLQQNSYHYLNVYLPIWKPSRHQSNMNIIPYDALEKHVSADVLARLKGGGARRGKVRNGKTVLVDDENGGHDLLPFDLTDLSIIPELDAGDLLLMRGDMLHRTQDVDTDRVAVSFRLVQSHSQMSRRRLGQLCLSKLMILAGRIGAFGSVSALYQRGFDTFEAAGQDVMALADFNPLHAKLYKRHKLSIQNSRLIHTFCREMCRDEELYRTNVRRIKSDVHYLLEQWKKHPAYSPRPEPANRLAVLMKQLSDNVERGMDAAEACAVSRNPRQLAAAFSLICQSQGLVDVLGPDVPEVAPKDTPSLLTAAAAS